MHTKAERLAEQKADAEQQTKLKDEVARLATEKRLANEKAEADRVAHIEVELSEVITHHACRHICD